MDLNEIRQGIDKIDDQISALYLERMNLVKQVRTLKSKVEKQFLTPKEKRKFFCA